MSKKGLPNILILVCLISGIYIVYVGYLLYPYLIMFFNNKYIVEPNDLPNYRDVFNSIFLVTQIIITSVLTFLLYRTAELQRKQNYEINNTKIASYLFYELKFSLMGIIASLYTSKISNILDEEIAIVNELTGEVGTKSGLESIKGLKELRTFPITDSEKLKDSLSEITHLLGNEIDDKDIMFYFLFIMDLNKATCDNSDSFAYVLNENCNSLCKNQIVGAKKLDEELYGFLYNNDFKILDDRFKKLFDRLYEIKSVGC